MLKKANTAALPEKARLLQKLKKGNFNVPDFIYVSASDFTNEAFNDLKAFLDRHRESFKVITRSAHPQERCFKGGTFDSLETYADVSGIRYARNKMIKSTNTASTTPTAISNPELDMIIDDDALVGLVCAFAGRPETIDGRSTDRSLRMKKNRAYVST